MEKFPNSTGRSQIGSPERFDELKRQYAGEPADWSSLEKMREQKSTAPWDDPRWQYSPEDNERLQSRIAATTRATQNYLSQDAKPSLPQKVVRALSEPPVAGAIAGTSMYAALVFGIGNSPSDLVLQYPDLMNAFTALGSAGVGIGTGVITRDAYDQRKLAQAKHINPERSL